jgi:ubiquinone biosynthesis monooxygenase Coq7
MTSRTSRVGHHGCDAAAKPRAQTLAVGCDDRRRMLPQARVADLRTDHAVQSGAVRVYRGIRAMTPDLGVGHFAPRPLATEARHMARIEPLLAAQQRSRLLPLWPVAGGLTGALPAQAASRAAFASIEAVESFVDPHHAEQIETIDRHAPPCAGPLPPSVPALLQACRSNEIAHGDAAAALHARNGNRPSWALRVWVGSLRAGSRVSMQNCRRV